MSFIKPNHAAIHAYYAELDRTTHQAAHEGAVSIAFLNLLNATARAKKWTVVHQQTIKTNGKSIRPDGVLRDQFKLPYGYWEAKDSADDLDAEIFNKKQAGYPLSNTIFEDTREGVLYQHGQEAYRADLSDPTQLARLLSYFYDYDVPNFAQFEKAVEHFQQEIPALAEGLKDKIEGAHQHNQKFQAAFDGFFEVCRTSLNPNLSREAVDEMLIQHLLTERLIRTVFDNPDFRRRNVIAHEIEKVIDALTSKYFNRHEFLGALDRFYEAIENAAADLADFAEKQHFLNTVYERFFQGYSVQIADTHGIVYTPQEIVDFMCAAVEEVLQAEFGLSLGDQGVNVLDPCTGTGNFIVNLMRRVPRQHLPRVYREQLFANEVMLMPYYIASLNIEHEYYDLTGEYQPFEGICFVDTLDLVAGEGQQIGLFTEANAERVSRQRRKPITVVIGNPPYNMGQLNENDNNKNRKYKNTDERVQATYVKDSTSTLRNKLYDPYVKFFRWATDRLQDWDGLVCFVSNNSFVDQIAFDGMRKHLLEDFTTVYHVDLHGNVRQNPQLSGSTHNVFGIQVGVGITIAVRSSQQAKPRLLYHRVPEFWRKEEKLRWLETCIELQPHSGNEITQVPWQELRPNSRHTWLIPDHEEEYSSFLSIGTKEVKAAEMDEADAIFKMYSLGIATNKDSHVYAFNRDELRDRAKIFVEIYNTAVDKLRRQTASVKPEDLIDTNDPRIKWTRQVKRSLRKLDYSEFDEEHIRTALYRPFTSKLVYFDDFWVEERYLQYLLFPIPDTEAENHVIALTTLGSEKPFMVMMARTITDLHLVGAGCGTQNFPFFVYDDDGTNRRENITDWALAQFREHYADKSITKWDIFYYVYGLLHHPAYREKYADNLKRELPRIPYTPDFWAFSKAGHKLADLHLNYETAQPYDLEWVIEGKPTDEQLYHVKKMVLRGGKTEGRGKDRRVVRYPDRVKVNDYLTLKGLPPEVFAYRLGNRSALEWVIDQYRIKTDKRSGITSDPNNPDDPQYIVNLVGRVITTSLETCHIVESLPEDFGG